MISNDKLSIVFPGQGSQSIGMLRSLSTQYPKVQEIFTEASYVLEYDLWNLVQNGPKEQLDKTEYTQPALLVSSFAIWNVWRSINSETKVSFMAGHSLGEYTALVCSEAIDFLSAVKLVQSRGRFMQNSSQVSGAMVAIIGLENKLIDQVCNEASLGEILVPANYNSLGQTVLSGQASAVERAVSVAKKLGAKIAKILPVSVASHCMLMEPAAQQLSELLENTPIKSPKIPVIQNADVSFYDNPEQIREALVRQLYSPLRWVEIIQFMIKSGVKRILECGPGNVLTGLNKRINTEITCEPLLELK